MDGKRGLFCHQPQQNSGDRSSATCIPGVASDPIVKAPEPSLLYRPQGSAKNDTRDGARQAMPWTTLLDDIQYSPIIRNTT